MDLPFVSKILLPSPPPMDLSSTQDFAPVWKYPHIGGSFEMGLLNALARVSFRLVSWTRWKKTKVPFRPNWKSVSFRPHYNILIAPTGSGIYLKEQMGKFCFFLWVYLSKNKGFKQISKNNYLGILIDR